jgi:hypothetical protein
MAARPRRTRSPRAGPQARGEEVVALLLAYRSLSWFNRVSTSVAGAGRVTDRYGITPAATGAVHPALPFSCAACLTPGDWIVGRRGAWPAPAVLGPGPALGVALTGVAGLVILAAGPPAQGGCRAPTREVTGRARAAGRGTGATWHADGMRILPAPGAACRGTFGRRLACRGGVRGACPLRRPESHDGFGRGAVPCRAAPHLTARRSASPPSTPACGQGVAAGRLRQSPRPAQRRRAPAPSSMPSASASARGPAGPRCMSAAVAAPSPTPPAPGRQAGEGRAAAPGVRRADTPPAPSQLTSGRLSLGSSRPLNAPRGERPPARLAQRSPATCLLR